MVLATAVVLRPSVAAATSLTLDVRIRLIPDAQPTDASVVLQCDANLPVVLLRRAPGSYEYHGALYLARATTCEFLLSGQPNADYVARSVKVAGQTLMERPRSTLQFFLSLRPSEFTWRYVKDGERYINDESPDRTIGYFEPAYAALTSDNTDDYRVLATYGYANGLQRACMRLGYMSCGVARQRYDSLLKLFSERSWSIRCGLTRQRLEQERGDTLDKERNVLYGQIPSLVGEGDFLPAAHLALRGLGELEQDPKGFRDVGLTRKRLLTDAGDAFTKAGLESESQGDSGQALELFGAANEQLAQIKNPDGQVAKSLALVRAKLGEH